MKLIDKTYSENIGTHNQIAKFKNELTNIIWAVMPTECTKNYYEINRAIFKAIDSHVGSVYAEYRVEQEHTRKMGEHLEPYVKHTLAQLLVEELIKSDDFKIIKHENWLIGKVEFGVLLPFLKAIDKGSSGV